MRGGRSISEKLLAANLQYREMSAIPHQENIEREIGWIAVPYRLLCGIEIVFFALTADADHDHVCE